MLDAVEPDLRAGKPVDLMTKVCRPLPAYVIAYMMGVEDDMIPTVIRWSDLMADATLSGFPVDYDNDPHWLAAERARMELAAYLKEQYAYRRNKPGKDLISTLVHARLGKELSEEAMTMNTRQLLFAGNETTAKWLGHILVTFGRRHDVREAVNTDRTLLAAAIEEVMRWQGVSQVLPRDVRTDMVLEGVQIKAGQEIIMIMGGANRDPERYPNPDELDIYRERKPHLGFGLGLHSCLGAVLARMEASEFTAAVLDRFPDFRVVEPVLYTNFSLRGPSAVHVQLESSFPS
jgi:cytochrome P450